MPLSLVLPLPSSPADALRSALIGSLHAAHRPELADVVASADLAVDLPGVWLRPADATVSPVWLEEQLVEAALESGLPLASIRVLEAAGQGSGLQEKETGEAAGLVVPGLRRSGARRPGTVPPLLRPAPSLAVVFWRLPRPRADTRRLLSAVVSPIGPCLSTIAGRARTNRRGRSHSAAAAMPGCIVARSLARGAARPWSLGVVR